MRFSLGFVRFKIFQALEWLVNRLRNGSSEVLQHHLPADVGSDSARYLWVYSSTIGELHAAQPLLMSLLMTGNAKELVILTDHHHYTEAFLRVFPNALIVDHGQNGNIVEEIKCYPPDLFILAEIPCSLSDAPCRFSYRVIFELKKRTVPIVAVNGWLYGESPSCRMDWIEKVLLQRDYLRAIDLFMVQTNDVKEQLVITGAEAEKIEVTGNIKFDAVFVDETQLVTPDSLRPLMESLQLSGRPCIVAGCISNVSEQEYVLDAFAQVIEKKADALLVLAPRHPENIERMSLLSKLIKARDLPFILRSDFKAGSLEQVSVIVLDTIGELRHLYAAGDVCFVGLNHNVLEPLALNKPVFVSNGWKAEYPSFPVYQETKNCRLIIESTRAEELASQLLNEMASATDKTELRLRLGSLCGATNRAERLISKLL